jgi:hypothetical protein
VSVAIDKQPSSTRVRTLRHGNVPRQPSQPVQPLESGVPEPAPVARPEPSQPPPQYAKTMALPQAVASLPVKTTLGQSASEIRPVVPAPRKPLPRGLIAGGAAVAVAVVVAVVALRPSSPARPLDAPEPPTPVRAAPAPAPRTFRVTVAVTPAEAELELDGLPAGRGAVDRQLTADGREHALRATAPGFEPRTITFVDAPPARTLELTRTAPAVPEPKRKPGPRTRTEKPRPPVKPSVGANQAPILKE